MNIVLNNIHIGPFINSLASSGGLYGTPQNRSFNQIVKIFYDIISRGGSRAAATSKMECFVIISR